MKRNITIEIGVAILMVLFAYTAVSKFIDYPKFVFQMQLAPVPFIKSIAPFLGWIIPIVETIIVIGLSTMRYRLKALFASLGLLLAFEIYIAAMLMSGLKLPCACGGLISTLSWKMHLIFNAFFLLITTVTIIQINKMKLPDSPANKKHTQDLSRA